MRFASMAVAVAVLGLVLAGCQSSGREEKSAGSSCSRTTHAFSLVSEVELRMCPKTFHRGDPITISVLNQGNDDIGFGSDFEVFREGKSVLRHCAFTAELDLMMPGAPPHVETIGTAGRKTICVDLQEPGSYSLTKDICGGGSCHDEARMTVTFRIQGPHS